MASFAAVFTEDRNLINFPLRITADRSKLNCMQYLNKVPFGNNKLHEDAFIIVDKRGENTHGLVK